MIFVAGFTSSMSVYLAIGCVFWFCMGLLSGCARVTPVAWLVTWLFLPLLLFLIFLSRLQVNDSPDGSWADVVAGLRFGFVFAGFVAPLVQLIRWSLDPAKTERLEGSGQPPS